MSIGAAFPIQILPDRKQRLVTERALPVEAGHNQRHVYERASGGDAGDEQIIFSDRERRL